MLFAQLSQLTRLVISSCLASDTLKGRDTRSLSCLVNLQQLSICYAGAPASVYLHLTAISCLTRLECYIWEDEIIGLSQLQDLHVKCCQIDAFPGNTVSNLCNLESLDLTMQMGWPFDLRRLSEAASSPQATHRQQPYSHDWWQDIGTLSRLQGLHLRIPDCLTQPLLDAVFPWNV